MALSRLRLFATGQTAHSPPEQIEFGVVIDAPGLIERIMTHIGVSARRARRLDLFQAA